MTLLFKRLRTIKHTTYILYIYLGEIAELGPTSFEFMVPDDAPITISPSVGTIQPGEVSVQGS